MGISRARHQILSAYGDGKTRIYCGVLSGITEVYEKVWRCRFNEPVDQRPVPRCSSCGEPLLARTQAEHEYAEYPELRSGDVRCQRSWS